MTERPGQGTRLLVTGSTGMAGRFIVPELLNRGFEVRGLFNRAPGGDSRVEWRQMDMMKSLDFSDHLAGCDGVIHLAAELSNASVMDRINVDATRALVAAAKQAGTRYVAIASSVVVYGSPTTRVVDEGSPTIDPTVPIIGQYHAEPYMLDYARTKMLAEQAAREACDGGETIVDLLRPAVVADKARLLEARDWSMGRRIGASYRRSQYIYADDAAAAIGHLLGRGLAERTGRSQVEVYNIADPDDVTFRELFRIAHDLTGDPAWRVPVSVPWLLDLLNDAVKYKSFARRYHLGALHFSTKKLRATGFEVPTGVLEAFRQAIAAQPRPGS